MKNHLALKITLLVVLIALLASMLYACQPYVAETTDRYPIVDDENNYDYKDHTTKDEAVDRVTNSLDNLLEYLDQDAMSSQGYYIGADIAINSTDPEEGESAFILKIRANLYTMPYPEEPVATDYVKQYDDPEYLADLAQYKKDKAAYNATIKKSDIILEWYDGMTNSMLIGFYFDGVKQNMADSGNNLYLNLLGSKRLFEGFGDTVLFQQIVRLLTQFNLDTILASTTGDDSGSGSATTLNSVLKAAIVDNYKQVLNDEIVSIYFDSVSLNALTSTITDYIQNFFGPYEDKLDPLTNKYLGFKFSTLGGTAISTLNSNMQYLITPLSYFGITSEGDKEILNGAVVELNGNSSVTKKDKKGYEYKVVVPFESVIQLDYSLHISSEIVIDKTDYLLYENGKYEFIGELFIPNEDQKEYELKLDALVRTDVNQYDNSKNRVFAEFRDKANDDLIIGLYYKDEPEIIKDQLTYIDIEGLQHLYGGIKFEDINLPKAYKAGFDLSSLLAWVSELIDYYIVAMVDELLSPSEDSSYDNLTSVIMSKMVSTMKTEDDPTSRNTISIRIDMDLIRQLLRETNPTGGSFDNEQLISTVNEMFGIELDAIASILGYDVEELIDQTWFYFTYDVDEYSICIKAYQDYDELTSSTSVNRRGSQLIMKLDLQPTKIGQEVKIVFPDFSEFLPLKKIMTYSGFVEGQFMFAMTEEVDLSKLMGAFIGDLSGKNTHYILPNTADVHFEMYYDQYIREQILNNGRWTRSSRSAFNILFYAIENDVRTDLFQVYANDVSFNTGDPIEEMGYVWVDLKCIDGMPKMKIREDYFLEYFYQYMGYNITDDDEITLGLTDIIKAFTSDSAIVFEPDVIRITTANKTIQNFFGVDDLLGTLSAQIGFTQRVIGIDELESYFAMYTVGEFNDIAGESPYSIKLHDTIPVYFDYGTRVETKDFYFDYDPDSIAVENNKTYYYPTFDGLFMGVTRSYTVTITGIEDAHRSTINELVDSEETWEPLPIRQLPSKVRAYYGTSEYPFEYSKEVLYDFFGYYDLTIDYYVIPNDEGYNIIYDMDNDVFIVGLGSNYKYDKIYNVIDESETVYYKEYTTDEGISMVYDIGSRYAGYYVVQNVGINILYYYPGGVEVIKKHQDITNEDTEMVTQFKRKDGFYLVENESDIEVAEALLGDGGLVMALKQSLTINENTTTHTYVTLTLEYDMGSGFFMVKSIINYDGKDLTPDYNLLYSPVGGAQMYTTEEISLEIGVDPTLNESVLVKEDFFLYNPTQNMIEGYSVDEMQSLRYNELINILGYNVTLKSSVYSVPGTLASGQLSMQYDMQNGYYFIDIVNAHFTYTVIYDGRTYYVNKSQEIANAAEQILGIDYVEIDDGTMINWDTVGRKNNKWEDVEFTLGAFNKIDWSNRKWNNIEWLEMPIEIDENGYFTSPLEGGIFIVDVSIGKGMMATFNQYLVVTIINRTIDTNSYVNVTVDVEANQEAFPFVNPSINPTQKVIAPVVNVNNTIKIDPYAYILLKADYVKSGKVPSTFVQWLFEKYAVTLNFTTIYGDERDTAPEIGHFQWYFDDTRSSSIYYRETDIHNRVAEGSTDITYIYTIFEGQVIALKLEVESRTISGLRFEGEEYDGTYTVDAIVEESYEIPTKPIIIFNELDENGNNYTLDLSDYNYRSSTIFARFYNEIGVSIQNESLASPNTQLGGLINWTNPVADNVQLNNVTGTRELGDTNGDGIITYPYEVRDYVKPFAGSTSDVDSSFLDIQGFVDPYQEWFSEDWFSTQVVTVIVLMPNKIVDSIDYNVDSDVYTVSDIIVQEGRDNGVYYLDPYDISTWTLPNTIAVRFNNGDGTYYQTDYDVTWEADSHIQMDANGNFTFINPSTTEEYYIIATHVGSQKVGIIDLFLLVRNLSGIVERVSFEDANGKALAGSLDIAPSFATEYGNAYQYNVNTYKRFEMPSVLKVLFADGTIRSYPANWSSHAPWVQGTKVVAYSTIGTTLSNRIPLVFNIEESTITDISFRYENSTVEKIDVDIANKKITISNAYINNGQIDGRSPYDYLGRILGTIDIKTAESPDTITITDVFSNAKAQIFAKFDTQKVITSDGQSYTICLGQGEGADDYTVVFKANGGKTILSYTMEEDLEKRGNYPMYDFRIFNDDNQMDYPDGFNLSEKITLTVSYSDGTSQTFGAGTTNILTDWVVSMPTNFTLDGTPISESAVSMLGIKESDVINVISAIVLSDGGSIWVSAMLPDSSRVYVRLNAVCPEITSNFSSDVIEGSSFNISNGTITITDFYDVFPLDEKITVDKLPTTIIVHNEGESIATGIRVDGIVWTLEKNIRNVLEKIDYKGKDKFKLATATIWGNTVELYLEVKDCTVNKVSYTDKNNYTKDFESYVGEGNILNVDFDAYWNNGYNGMFVLPSNLTIHFVGGGKHVLSGADYYVAGMYGEVTQVPYDYDGHKLPTESKNYIEASTMLADDEQKVNIRFNFLDKTVTNVIFDTKAFESDPTTSNKYTIDPYGDNIEVPTTVTIKFVDGRTITNRVNWTKPNNYEVKYDTYRRVLQGKGEFFEFTSLLDYSGISSQDLDVQIYIRDRVLESWGIMENQAIYDYSEYSKQANVDPDNPNSFYVFDDPFKGRASDLPSNILATDNGINQDLQGAKIVWDFTDDDITAGGTLVLDSYNKYGIVYKGYIKNKEVGQPVTIRVYITAWEYQGIRKMLGGTYQKMAEVQFYFSSLTGKSTDDAYQIIFKKTTPGINNTSKSIEEENVEFYPEDRVPPIGGEDYIIMWDDETLNRAANNKVRSQGSFYLGNAKGEIKITPNDEAIYEFETPVITALDLGYGYGANNNAIYVVNPLEPDFGEKYDNNYTYISNVKAKVTKNQETNIEVDNVIIKFSNKDFVASSSIERYINGGIYAGYPVTVVYSETIKNKATGQDVRYTIEQEFDIMLVFLDMSPIETFEINKSDLFAELFKLDTKMDMSIKTVYKTTTYNGKVNPYRDTYSQVISALNQALFECGFIDEYGSPVPKKDIYGHEVTDDYGNTVYTNQFTYLIEWSKTEAELKAMKDTIYEDTTIYSKTVTVVSVNATRKYTSTCVKLLIHADR